MKFKPMSPEVILSGLAMLMVLAALVPHVPAAPADDYEVWADCGAQPPPELRISLPSAGGFVDLGSSVKHAGVEWKALQFTQDSEIPATVPAGKYLRGLIGDDWPAGTMDVFRGHHAAQLAGVEIDGALVEVTRSCMPDPGARDGAFAIYNVWPRFNKPGAHTLRYFWQPKRPFYFRHPSFVSDEFGGRRVFVQQEERGDAPLDGTLTLTYLIKVVPSVGN